MTNEARAITYQKLARILFRQGNYEAASAAYASARALMGVK